jgi:hypothetical protein
MSEYPIPHGEHYDFYTLRRSYRSAFLHPEKVKNLHFCILRRSCKSAFLHPEEEIQGLIDLPQG